jgi:SAM-dependent methyltransferase
MRCPACGSEFALAPAALVCPLGHAFPYHGNMIDLSAAQEIDRVQERSKQSFEVEWSRYYPDLGWNEETIAQETDLFLRYTKAMPNFFSDKIIIDAGCGNGRYINIVNQISSPPPKLIVGVDVSDAIVVAAKNCSAFHNVLLIKSDLNLLPKILKQPVDYIYSIGVLHHTPDAERAFANLARCVKAKGFLSMALYGKGNPVLYRTNFFLRNRLFHKLPHWLTYYLCWLMAVPCQIFRVKFVGPWMLDLVNRFVFVSPDAHNMYDAYSAGWTSFHERAEVEQWYRNGGFECVVEPVLNDTCLYAIGRKVKDPVPSVPFTH